MYDLRALRRKEFPWSERGEAVYLNHASTGPLPERAIAVTTEWARMRAIPSRISDALEFETLARGRELVARLIHADSSEIALAVNTTYGINLAASSLPLRAGDVVLTPDLEFPANVYPWMQLARQRGVIYRRLPVADGGVDEPALLRALDDPAVKLVAVSWTGFASGYTVDLRALGSLCRERGIWFVVDAIQGLGPRTLDLREVPVDILSCGGQKWLLSPWGTGFVYVRRELVAQLEPHVVSWMSVRGSDDFTRLVDYDLTWRENARRFENITLPYQDFAGMNASLELLHELGPADVERHVAELVDEVVRWTESQSRVRLVTPAEPGRRAGIVAVRPPDAPRAHAALNAAGVAHSLREGNIRLAPYCYNTHEEIRRAIAIIESAS